MEISKVIERAKAFILEHNTGINIWDLYKDFDDESCDYIGDYEQAADIQDIMGADDVEYGATKVVLFYNDIPNWVVKVPIFGKHNVYYDKDIEDYEEDDQNPYTDFSFALDNNCIEYYASIPVENNDYCSVEAAMYEEAKKRGIEEYFAPTYFVVSIDGVPFYISRNYNISCCTGNIKSGISDEEYSKASELSWKYDNRFYSSTVIAAILKYWGVEALQILSDFFEEFNINDIHSGNIQYMKIGENSYKPGIIDYSGYHECY